MIATCRILQSTPIKMCLALQMLLVVAFSASDISATTTIDVINASELRLAVDTVNASTTDTAYTIRMAPGTYALSGTPDDALNLTGDLDIAPSGTVTELTLESNGGTVILDGSGQVRLIEVFPHVASALTLNLNNFTIQNGSTALLGGGIFVNAAESGSEVSVNLNGVILSGNTAGESGGGIAVGSNNLLTVTDSTLSANSTDFNGGGLFCFACSANITNTLFFGNIASPPVNGIGGGAIFNCGGTVTTDQTSIIQDNQTDPDTPGDWYGGALSNTGIGAMTVNSTISHSLNSGSGIFNQGGIMTLSFEERNPILPGDLVVLSGTVSFSIRGILSISGAIYDPGGNVETTSRPFAMPWMMLLL